MVIVIILITSTIRNKINREKEQGKNDKTYKALIKQKVIDPIHGVITTKAVIFKRLKPFKVFP